MANYILAVEIQDVDENEAEGILTAFSTVLSVAGKSMVIGLFEEGDFARIQEEAND